LAHLVPIRCSEKHYWRIPEMQEANVGEHHHAWALYESQSADPHLATTVAGGFGGNLGEQPQSDVLEESKVLEVFCINDCMETRGAHSELFLWCSEACNSEPTLGKFYVHIIFLFMLYCRFSFCRFGRAFSFHPVLICKDLSYMFW
jgi:hypothetical protein